MRQLMTRLGGFADVEDNRPLPGIEWRLAVDREAAAYFGADIATLGNAVQMVTNGIKVADYRPNHSDEEVDIRVRFPFGERNLEQLHQLRVSTASGMIPISNFVTLTPVAKIGTLLRGGSQRVLNIAADVNEGLLVDRKINELRAALAQALVETGVQVAFKG